MSRKYFNCFECGRDVTVNNSASCVHDHLTDRCPDVCYICWYKRIRAYEINDLGYVKCAKHNKSCEIWVDDNYHHIVISALYMGLDDEQMNITDLLDGILIKK